MPKPTGDSETVTLVANTVSTVTLDDDYDTYEVVNLTGTAAVWYTINGATPTVRGDAMLVVPAAVGGNERPVRGSGNTTVRLISTGTPEVYVGGF